MATGWKVLAISVAVSGEIFILLYIPCMYHRNAQNTQKFASKVLELYILKAISSFAERDVVIRAVIYSSSS
jgi:hypothetical protein